MLTGFLIGAISVLMIFTMFEIMNKDKRDSDSWDKWGQIFGMSMIWLLAIGLILAFTLPVDASAVTDYSAAGIK